MTLQTAGAVPRGAVELVLTASTETKIVLGITALFSLVSWFIIVLKWWQFRKLNRQADRFFAEMERTTRLQDAYHAVMKQPPSPYNRLFREAITFYSELRPGALREERGADRSSLTTTQLEASLASRFCSSSASFCRASFSAWAARWANSSTTSRGNPGGWPV